MAVLRSRPRALVVIGLLSICIIFILVYRSRTISDTLPAIQLPHLLHSDKTSSAGSFSTYIPLAPGSATDAINEAHAPAHPIDSLLRKAETQVDGLVSKQTKGVTDAAEAYRKRRGRHPPPRFDQWVKFAEEHDAVIIEDFFDQIYEDLNPLWALNPKTMREAVLAWPHYISIRDGNVTHQVSEPQWRVDAWMDMIRQISQYLPDVDLAMNVIYEPRMVVPWESMDYYHSLASRRSAVPLETQQPLQLTADYPKRPRPKPMPEIWDNHLSTRSPIWSLLRQACPPHSAARLEPLDINLFESPTFSSKLSNGTDPSSGYITNATLAKNLCQNPAFHGLHGGLINPILASVPTTLFPLFGESKFNAGNDILLPSPSYWRNSHDFAHTGEVHVAWEDKQDKVMFRDEASGGRNELHTWARFHRHRFVSMLNDTHVRAAQIRRANELQNETYPPLGDDIHMYTWPLPDPSVYPIAALKDKHLGAWVENIADAAFTDLHCEPKDDRDPRRCFYTSPFYAIKDSLSTGAEYGYKYLPDLDSNGASERFGALLRSNSVPIKSSLYTEWADKRLVAWKHYVPLDTTFRDLWGVLEYFLGYDPSSYTEKEAEIGYIKNLTKTADASIAAAKEEDVKAKAKSRKARHLQSEPPITDILGFAPEAPSRAATIKQASKAASGANDLAAAARLPLQARVENLLHTIEDKIHIKHRVTPTERRQAEHPHSAAFSAEERDENAVKTVSGHDAVGKYIAESGSAWAQKVLRREDMLVYLYRVVLEYARVVDEGRMSMGYTGDIKEGSVVKRDEF